MSLSKRFVQMVKAVIKAVDPSSAMGIAQGQKFSHDSVYRVLGCVDFQPKIRQLKARLT